MGVPIPSPESEGVGVPIPSPGSEARGPSSSCWDRPGSEGVRVPPIPSPGSVRGVPVPTPGPGPDWGGGPQPYTRLPKERFPQGSAEHPPGRAGSCPKLLAGNTPRPTCRAVGARSTHGCAETRPEVPDLVSLMLFLLYSSCRRCKLLHFQKSSLASDISAKPVSRN